MVAIIFETSCQSLPRPRSIEARQQIPPIHASSLGNGSYEYTPYAPVPPDQPVRAAVSFVPLQDYRMYWQSGHWTHLRLCVSSLRQSFLLMLQCIFIFCSPALPRAPSLACALVNALANCWRMTRVNFISTWFTVNCIVGNQINWATPLPPGWESKCCRRLQIDWVQRKNGQLILISFAFDFHIDGSWFVWFVGDQHRRESEGGGAG